jgi:hypothetical protein
VRTKAEALDDLRRQLAEIGNPSDLEERGGFDVSLGDDHRTIMIWICDCAVFYELPSPINPRDFDPVGEMYVFLGGIAFSDIPKFLYDPAGAELTMIVDGRVTIH